MKCCATTKSGSRCKNNANNGTFCKVHAKTNVHKPSKVYGMFSRIQIENYTQKFTEYPPDFVEFCEQRSIHLPKIDSDRGQSLALMAQPENRGQRYLDGRQDTDKFFAQIGSATPHLDSIQAFNKISQIGIKPAKISKGKYALPFPFEADMTHVAKRKHATISGDRDTQINAIKEYWRTSLVDVPNDQWQVGHLNPEIGDASEANLAYQPPIQARYRDKYIWDSYFQLMYPTSRELIENAEKYYTLEQRKAIAIAFARYAQ